MMHHMQAYVGLGSAALWSVRTSQSKRILEAGAGEGRGKYRCKRCAIIQHESRAIASLIEDTTPALAVAHHQEHVEDSSSEGRATEPDETWGANPPKGVGESLALTPQDTVRTDLLGLQDRSGSSDSDEMKSDVSPLPHRHQFKVRTFAAAHETIKHI